MRFYATFAEASRRLEDEFKHHSYVVHTEKWQGLEIAEKPDMQMREVLFPDFSVQMRSESLDYWRSDIKPNLPFADVHFEERVSGKPTNPGEAWKIWPWGLSADKHRTANSKFTHTYQERFWPKQAGYEDDALHGPPMGGIRYPYGDLDDVIALLGREPLTRQAYLPIWFPEDTGAVHGGRVPCSLGYHFIMRNDFLHVTYGIRSCDFIRHWSDDCYFTVRLAIYVLENLRDHDPGWNEVKLGLFRMQIGSLHMFINDWNKMFGPVYAKTPAP